MQAGTGGTREDRDDPPKTLLDDYVGQIVSVTEMIDSGASIDKIFERIMETLSHVIRFDTTSIFLLEGDSLVIRAVRGFDRPESIIGYSLKLDEFPVDAKVIRTGMPVIIENVQERSDWLGENQALEGSRIRGWMGIPLKARGMVIGLLSIDSHTVGMYTQREADICMLFASQAAVAISNARIQTDLHDKITHLSMLTEISRTLSAGMQTAVIYEKVWFQLSRVFDASNFYVAVWNRNEEHWETAFLAEEGEVKPAVRFRFEKGFMSYLFMHPEPILFRSTREAAEYAASHGILRSGKELKSWMAVPLDVTDDIMAYFVIQDYESENAYEPADFVLFSTIASNMGVALRNAILYEQSLVHAKELETLVRVERELSADLDPGKTYERLVRIVEKQIPNEAIAIYAVRDGTLFPRFASGCDTQEIMEDSFPLGSGIIGSVAASGRTEVINRLDLDPRRKRIPRTEETPDERLMVVPLVDSGRTANVLAVWRGSSEKPFSLNEVNFTDALCRHAAVSIKNAELFSKVKESYAVAEEASKLKTQFIANMSHELRTPLNSIINLSFLMQADSDKPLSPDQAELASRIEKSGRHLLTLINEVLDLAKIESGKMELTRERSDILSIVNESVTDILPLLGDKPVAMQPDLPLSLPPLSIDRQKIKQVLLNLLSNAVKFTDSGRIVVTAGYEAESGRVWVTVSDTGMGIKDTDMAKAFTEFVQLDGGTDRKTGGSGLGLPIAKKIVELHGGEMIVKSALGKGSTFGFYLPLSPSKSKTGR